MGNPIINRRGRKASLIASPSTWIEGEALRQLDLAAELPGMKKAVGMPDLHPGKGGPNGAAFLTEGVIYPSLVGSDAGCGIALWQTDIPAHKAKADQIADTMDGLDRPWSGDTSAWVEGYGLLPSVHDASIGSPGRGNHFVEWCLVAEVQDEPAFRSLGMDRSHLHLLVHSGSRGFGEALSRRVAAEHGAGPLTEGTLAADDYLVAHGAAVQWAQANRDLCARRACEAVGADGRRLLDVCHNSVTAALVDGCRCWLHRKGAAPSDMGPVVIPGSRGDLSAVVQPVPSREDALFSIAHGAGRKLARHEARGKLRGFLKREDLKRNPWGGRVVCGEEMLSWEEAPGAYKPLASVVGDLEAAGLIQVIAFLRPLVTFKTSEAPSRQELGKSKTWKRDRREARAAKTRERL